MHFESTAVVHFSINMKDAADSEIDRELRKFMRDNEIYPLRGSSAGGPGYLSGNFYPEDAAKLTEWLTAHKVVKKESDA